MHPAIVAQAAATTASLFDGRFFLGVGTGENLNEHIVGDRWPPTVAPARHARGGGRGDAEAVGGGARHPPRPALHRRGRAHLHASRAPVRRLRGGRRPGGRRAGGRDRGRHHLHRARRRDARRVRGGGGAGPRYGQVTVCWAETEAEARRDGARVVAERRPPRPARSGAAAAEPLRAGRRDGDRGRHRRCDRLRP